MQVILTCIYNGLLLTGPQSSLLFLPCFQPVAFELGIPPENIIANQLLFGTSGEYAGFDPAEPTSRSGGKAKAVQQIKQV